MSRLWIRRLRCLALVGLAALPIAAFSQDAPSRPTDILVPARVGEPPADVLVVRSAAAAPQETFELAVAAPQGESQGVFAFIPNGVLAPPAATAPRAQPPQLYFTQGAAPPIEVRARLEEAPAGEYWIGVQLEPLPELITSQLKLERGMAVVHVFEDSPAAKAEFKTNDIVLRAGENDIKEPQDLVAAVSDAKEKELSVIVLRSGTETTLKVTPAKRQADHLKVQVSPETPHADVVRALERLYQKAPDGDVRLFAVRPGGVFAYAQEAKFPSDLEVTIEKHGDQPAKIRVKREDKTWETTDDKLGELPEDIRAHVQQLLGGQPPAGRQVLGLRLEAARREAGAQMEKAQAQARDAQKRSEETLREYRLRVQPVPPVPAGVVPHPQPPVAPPVSARATRVLVGPGGEAGIQAKLDAILKKLDQPQNDALQRLQADVEKLRKQVEDLRQDKK